MPLTADTPTPPRAPFIAMALASVLLLGFAAGAIWMSSQVAMVPSAVPANMAVEDGEDKASLSSSTHAPQLRLSSSGPAWREITEAQRQVLMPLRERWSSMGALAKRRWLVLADRYPKMDESERNKLVSRMSTWASLSAQQRNQARINFESVKRLSAQELQSKWDEYQALSDAEKNRLAEQARKAKVAKKSKRRLAQVPAKVEQPQPQTAPALSPPVVAAHPVATPSVVETIPVATPQAAPSVHLSPLERKSASSLMDKPEVPAVASQPIPAAQAIPSMELAPLPADISDVRHPAGPSTPVTPESAAPASAQ